MNLGLEFNMNDSQRRNDDDNRRIYDDVYARNPQYGRASPGRIEMIQRACIPRIPQGSTILYVGGGKYDFVKKLVDSGHVARGVVIDIAQAVIDYQSSVGVEAVCGSVNDMPFADNEFDIATSFDVLEHLDEEDIDTAISEIYRVMKSLAIITVSPHRCPHLGYELHKTRKNHDWWTAKFSAFGLLDFECL